MTVDDVSSVVVCIGDAGGDGTTGLLTIAEGAGPAATPAVATAV